MATQLTPQIAQACERWMQDKVLIDLLTSQRQAALELLGNTTVTEAMIRAQGVFKGIDEFLKLIQQGAAHAERLRHPEPAAPNSIGRIAMQSAPSLEQLLRN